MNLAMQINLSKSINHPSQSFASLLLAFGFLGSFHWHHMGDAGGRYRVNIVHSNQVPQSNGHLWCTPFRSPAFNELIGS
jgi:hypothetical protein